MVNNMFKQSIKKGTKTLMRYRRKKLWSVLSCCKDWMCTGKKKWRKVNIHTKYIELQTTEFTEIGSG